MNSFSPINPSLVDYIHPDDTGYGPNVSAGDTVDALKFAAGETSREFPKSLWIEPKDWADKARDNDKYKTWGMNYLDRYTHQGNSHECTSHSLRAIAEACRNRQRGVSFSDGPKKDFRYPESAEFNSVWLSPLSIYAEANPGQWGGASIRQVMEIAVRRGFLPEPKQPKDYKFKHTLHGTAGGTESHNQANGSWVRVSNFPSGWQETAKHFRPLEIIFPGSWEEAVCLVLNGYLVGVGRSGHAIPWALWNVAEQAMAYPDSYNTTRYDSKRTVQSAWSGSFAIATMTSPDSWDAPAG